MPIHNKKNRKRGEIALLINPKENTHKTSTIRKREKRRKKEKNPLGHHGIVLALRRVHRLLPPRRAETPLTPGRQADAAQVVAPGGGEVEELLGEQARDGVVAAVLGADAAVAVAVEARHRRLREEGERLAEHWFVVSIKVNGSFFWGVLKCGGEMVDGDGIQ